jgi:aerotolerance regulator-like protein
MPFLHPLLAATGLMAISIPIIIHFLLRRRRKPIVFGAMRFVIEAYRQQRSKLRLEQLLLLVLRCLVILLIAIAIARPKFNVGSSFGSQSDRSVYILLDTSVGASVRTNENDSLLTLLQASVDSFLNSLSDTDRVGFVALGAPEVNAILPPSSDVNTIRGLVSQSHPTDTAADLPAALNLVLDDLRTNPPVEQQEIQIVLATSQFEGSLDVTDPLPEELASYPNLSFVVLDPAVGSIPNTQITALRPLRSVLLLGEDQLMGGGQVTVTLHRTGGAERDDAVSSLRVWLEREGRVESSTPTTVRWQPGQQEATVVVQLQTTQAPREYTDTVLVAEIDRDALESDNIRRTPLPVRQVLNVGVLSRRRFGETQSVSNLGADEWIQRALVPGSRSPIDIRIIDPSTIDQAALAGLDAALLPRPDLVDTAGWERLHRFVMQGGLLLVTPPDQLAVHLWPEAFQQTFGFSGQLARETVSFTEPENLTQGLAASNALTLLQSELGTLLRPVQVHRALVFESTPDNADTIIELANSKPWLLRLEMDQPSDSSLWQHSYGTLLYLASSLHLEWTNLPAMPLMVPLLHELIRQGIESGSRATTSIAGDIPSVSPEAQKLVPIVSNAKNDIPLDSSKAVRTSGVYRVEDDLASAQGILVVNTNTSGAITNRVEFGEVQQWLVDAGVDQEAITQISDSGESQQTSNSDQSSAQANTSMSMTLLLAGLIIALLETILARFFSHASHAPILSSPQEREVIT